METPVVPRHLQLGFAFMLGPVGIPDSERNVPDRTPHSFSITPAAQKAIFSASVTETASVLERYARRGPLSKEEYSKHYAQCVHEVYEIFARQGAVPSLSNNDIPGKGLALQKGFDSLGVLLSFGGSAAGKEICFTPLLALVEQDNAQLHINARSYRLEQFPELDFAFTAPIKRYLVVEEFAPSGPSGVLHPELGASVQRSSGERAVLLFTRRANWRADLAETVEAEEVGHIVAARLTEGRSLTDSTRIAYPFGRTVRESEVALAEVHQAFSYLSALQKTSSPALLAFGLSAEFSGKQSGTSGLSATIAHLTLFEIPAIIPSLAQGRLLPKISAQMALKIDSSLEMREAFRNRFAHNLSFAPQKLFEMHTQLAADASAQENLPH